RGVGSEMDRVARAQPPGALGIAAPHTTAEIPRQRDLDRRVPAPADETGRDHLGVVEHQEIARPQQFGQIGDMPVGQLAGGRDHQQPGAVAAEGLRSPTGDAASDKKTLRFIAQSDLRVLDPVCTTAYLTRNHAYCVFDNLFAIDAEFAPHPQMVGDYNISADKLTYQFKL